MNVRTVATVVLFVAGLATMPAIAQTAGVTPADIQRLQDGVFEAGNDVSVLHGRDAVRAARLQTELESLREEVIYLKVKLRKRETVARSEYSGVRDDIEDLRSRARSGLASAGSTRESSAAAATSAGTAARHAQTPGALADAEVPVGTEVDVRLLDSLSSGTAEAEDRFEATTLADLTIDGRVAIPAGSIMRGVVSRVEPATRTDRTARLTVSFDHVTARGRSYPIRATVTQAIEGEGLRGEAGRIGVGAGAGAIIGGLLGGVRGALAGVLIGGGGTIAATEGREVELAQGTVLRVRFDSPVTIFR